MESPAPIGSTRSRRAVAATSRLLAGSMGLLHGCTGRVAAWCRGTRHEPGASTQEVFQAHQDTQALPARLDFDWQRMPQHVPQHAWHDAHVGQPRARPPRVTPGPAPQQPCRSVQGLSPCHGASLLRLLPRELAQPLPAPSWSVSWSSPCSALAPWAIVAAHTVTFFPRLVADGAEEGVLLSEGLELRVDGRVHLARPKSLPCSHALPSASTQQPSISTKRS